MASRGFRLATDGRRATSRCEVALSAHFGSCGLPGDSEKGLRV